VAKLSPDGDTLVYSTYLGGNSGDAGVAIAADAAGNAYVLGQTSSLNFPTVNAIQPQYGGGWSDYFVSKIDASGSAFAYSTFLGGSGSESEYGGFGGIAVDGKGRASVTGETVSFNFPTYKAFQPAYGGGPIDAFVTKLSPHGAHFVYSTYLGGSSGDAGRGIAADAAGNAFVTGYTASPNFPLANPFQATKKETDAFVTKLNADDSA